MSIVVLISLIKNDATAQGSLAALDAKNGFRDAKFGMNISSLKGMIKKLEYKGGSGYYYIRPTDKKRIGDIPLQSIRYDFLRGRLVSIRIIADIAQFDPLNATFQDAYGEGDCLPNFPWCEWKANKVKMSLFVIKNQDIVVVNIDSLTMSELFNQVADMEEKNNAKKRKADL